MEKMFFGERLHDAMASAGFTPTTFAAAGGWSERTVYRWLAMKDGKTIPAGQLQLISLITRKRMSWFLDGKGSWILREDIERERSAA